MRSLTGCHGYENTTQQLIDKTKILHSIANKVQLGILTVHRLPIQLLKDHALEENLMTRFFKVQVKKGPSAND